MYGDRAKTTTISVKLGDSDLALLDALKAKLDAVGHSGNPDPSDTWRASWREPSRSQVLRSCLRATADRHGLGDSPARGKTKRRRAGAGR